MDININTVAATVIRCTSRKHKQILSAFIESHSYSADELTTLLAGLLPSPIESGVAIASHQTFISELSHALYLHQHPNDADKYELMNARKLIRIVQANFKKQRKSDKELYCKAVKTNLTESEYQQLLEVMHSYNYKSVSRFLREVLPAFRSVISDIASNSTFQGGYIDGVMKRVKAFESDFSKKNFNSKLARQIYIVSAFASVVFEILTIAKKPKYIQWVSDRDALLERYDSFVFDLAYFLFLQGYSEHFERTENSVLMLDTPQFIFPEPEKSGKNYFDELIRIPDYLAGTLADFDVSSNKFSKDKYDTILLNSLVNSRNQAVIYVTGKGNELLCKRLVHEA